MNEGKTFIHAKMLVADYTDSVVAPATSTEAVKQFAYAVKDAARINPNITFVVIMPGNLQYGLARMLDSYTHGISWQKHIVRTEAECQKLIELLV